MTHVHVWVLPASMEVHVWFWELRSPASVQLDSLDNFVKIPSIRIYMSLSVVERSMSQMVLSQLCKPVGGSCFFSCFISCAFLGCICAQHKSVLLFYIIIQPLIQAWSKQVTEMLRGMLSIRHHFQRNVTQNLKQRLCGIIKNKKN